MTFSREWMYQIGTSEFYDGIEEFIKQADSFARSKGFVDGTVQCPCNSCKTCRGKMDSRLLGCPLPHILVGHPKKNIDVFLQPLIDELYVLRKDGFDTYDAFRERKFNLKAALMWTINDFPAYGMLSGWSTHGRLSSPYCMEKSKAFHLKHGRKTSFFDCHRQFLPKDHPFRRNKDSFTKGRVENNTPPSRLSGLETWRRVQKYPKVTDERYPIGKNLPGFRACHNWTKKSIFWDLPYWKTNLIQHNLDVMDVEKNVFDNIFNIVMDDKDKTKDNVKARQDVKEYCRRHELELVMEANGNTLKPNALYTLNKEQKKVVL
nr:hypothetical protein [Tanacetum cinerariifolium]